MIQLRLPIWPLTGIPGLAAPPLRRHDTDAANLRLNLSVLKSALNTAASSTMDEFNAATNEGLLGWLAPS